jgi:hypothetical protein
MGKESDAWPVRSAYSLFCLKSVKFLSILWSMIQWLVWNCQKGGGPEYVRCLVPVWTVHTWEIGDYDEGIDTGARNVLGLGARRVRLSPVHQPYDGFVEVGRGLRRVSKTVLDLRHRTRNIQP